MFNFYLADIADEKYNSSSAIGSLLWTVYFLLTVFRTTVLTFVVYFLFFLFLQGIMGPGILTNLTALILKSSLSLISAVVFRRMTES